MCQENYLGISEVEKSQRTLQCFRMNARKSFAETPDDFLLKSEDGYRIINMYVIFQEKVVGKHL